MSGTVTRVSDNFVAKMALAEVVEAGDDDLEAGTLQEALQALATRIAVLEAG